MQVFADELARFAATQGLSFDERSLLEHLLGVADHRTGVVDPFSVTDLAHKLGLGPSARRTLPKRLERLSTAGALRWARGRPGPLEIVVYSRLVHGDAEDNRRGFVQLVPSAITRHAGRHGLSPTTVAVLTRLLIEADPRTQTVAATSPRQLADRLGLGRGRLEPAIDELVAAGSIAWGPGQPLRVTGYAELVRTAPVVSSVVPARSQPGRAADPSKRAPDHTKARAALGVSSRAQDPDDESKTTPPSPPKSPAGGALDGRGWDLMVQIKTTLTDPQRTALHDPADRGRLAQLSSRLERLLDGGWAADELVAHVGASLPGGWRSPARLLWARAETLPVVPPTPITEAEAAEVAAATAEAEALAAAELHRRRECQEARRQGIDFVRWGNDRDNLAVLHADDAEALAAALAGYEAAQEAWHLGSERARAGASRFGLRDDYGDDELLWAAQAGYDAAGQSPTRSCTTGGPMGGPNGPRSGSLAARAASVGRRSHDGLVGAISTPSLGSDSRSSGEADEAEAALAATQGQAVA